MQYIQRDRLIHIEWSIFRGTSDVPEDFSRALVRMFLIGNNEKYLLTATAEGGKLLADLPEGLPEGAYSLEALWVKNYGNLLPHRQPLTPGGEPVCPRRPGSRPNDPAFLHPHDHRFNDRCLMRSRKDYVFALTDYPSEETYTGESGEATVRCASSVATYGYDGLSAYQIAVMRGDFSGSEGEYLEQQKYTLPTATEMKLGGIKAAQKTDKETVEVKIDPESGKLYVPPSEGKALEVATENKLGGIKAATKTSLETQEVKIDPATGKLYTQPGGEGGVEIVNNPDEEDLHSIEKSADVHVLQFADKEYNASAFSGLGRVYLRKNISSGKNVLTQAMMNKANTRYIIQYDYDLDGETITVPEGCTLDFQGGSLKNGCVIGNKSKIEAGLLNIFNNTLLESNWITTEFHPEWWGAVPDANRDNVIPLQNMLDSMGQIDSSKTIVFASGTYITSKISLSGTSNITFKGKNTIIKYAHENSEISNGDDLLYITSGDKSCSDIFIEGITFIGGWSNLHIESTNGYLIEHISVTNNSFNTTKSGALYVILCRNIRISNNSFKEGGDNGIYCAFSEDAVITSNIVYNCYGSGGIVVGYKNSEFAEGFIGGKNILIESNNIYANYQDEGNSVNQYGIDVVMADNINIIGNSVYTHPDSKRKISNGIAIEEWGIDSVNIISNIVNNVREFAIGLGISIDPETTYINKVNITNNVISSANYGIRLHRVCHNILIKDNSIEKFNKCGVYIEEDSCDGVNVINNIIKDCGLQDTWAEPSILDKGINSQIIGNLFIDSQSGGVLSYKGNGTATYSISGNKLIIKENNAEVLNTTSSNKTWGELKEEIEEISGFSIALINNCEDIEIIGLRRTGARRNDNVNTLSVNGSFITTPEPVWYLWESGSGAIIRNNKVITNSSKLPANIRYNGDNKWLYYETQAKLTDFFEKSSKTIDYNCNLDDFTMEGVYTNYNSSISISNRPTTNTNPFTLFVISDETGNKMQIYMTNSNNYLYLRIRNGSSWMNWMYISDARNTLGATANRPTSTAADGFCYFDTDVNKALWKLGASWVDENQMTPGKHKGPTNSRPSNLINNADVNNNNDVGYMFFDTSLKKYIVWNGTGWTNLDGTSL